MRTFWLVLLAACDGGAPAPAPTISSHPVATAAADARVDTPTTLDAAVAVDAVSAAVRAAPASIGRVWTLGAGMVSSPHTTYTLQHAGEQAILTVEVREPTAFGPGKGPDREPTAWQTTKRTEYVGTVSDAAGVLTLAVAHGAETLSWRCTPRHVKAASATAVRGRTPGIEGCGGDEGRWVPARTTPVQLLACEVLPIDEYSSWDSGWSRIGLAPAPGIEWLFVNDHCVIQGGGWRRVGSDGAIAGIRQRGR